MWPGVLRGCPSEGRLDVAHLDKRCVELISALHMYVRFVEYSVNGLFPSLPSSDASDASPVSQTTVSNTSWHRYCRIGTAATSVIVRMFKYLIAGML